MAIKFEIRDSRLLRLALAESRFSPFDLYEDGAYPDHQDAKAEVERLAETYLAPLDAEGLKDALAEHAAYLSEWQPERLEQARTPQDFARLCAFAEIHAALMRTEAELRLASFSAPRETDPVFDAAPALFGSLQDGMIALAPENIDPGWVATNAVFFVGEGALFPHPLLAGYRELLGLLAELAGDPALRVLVALDPHRHARREDLQYRLLEDYWDGMKLTRETLDSLDGHDQGTSFHAAVGRNEAETLFNPLLGTWFDWRGRADDPDDPVKRLYIREVKPPHGPFGREIPAVLNRELHAERDTAARRFTHVDGKVCRYPLETYPASASDPRAALPAPERARKLWRVDGPMSDTQWCELVGQFYRGNELIAEHLGNAFTLAPGSG